MLVFCWFGSSEAEVLTGGAFTTLSSEIGSRCDILKQVLSTQIKFARVDYERAF